MPLFNREELVPLTLQSILEQDDDRWECIIVDDNSTDSSPNVAREFCNRDDRFTLLSNHTNNHNGNVCRNIGLKKAKGDYLIFLDSDDILPADRVGLTIKYFEAHPEQDAIIFDCHLFHEEPGDNPYRLNKRSFDDYIIAFLQYDVPWLTSSPSWKRPAVLKLGGWHEDLPWFQDIAFHLRALSAGIKYQIVPEIGYYYRVAKSLEGKTGVRNKDNHLAGLKAAVVAFDELRNSPIATRHHIQTAEGVVFFWLNKTVDKGRFSLAMENWFAFLRHHKTTTACIWGGIALAIRVALIRISDYLSRGQLWLKEKLPHKLWPAAGCFQSETHRKWIADRSSVEMPEPRESSKPQEVLNSARKFKQ